jgi:hypothetical protein
MRSVDIVAPIAEGVHNQTKAKLKKVGNNQDPTRANCALWENEGRIKNIDYLG